MQRTAVAGLLFGGVAVLAGAAWYFELWPFRSEFKTACEEVLKDRLRSPSSYRLVSYREEVQPVSRDEFIDFSADEQIRLGDKAEAASVRETTQKLISGIRDEDWEAFKMTAALSYDASNAYGTAVRELAICEYMALSASTKPNKTSVRINGLGSLAHLMRDFRALTRPRNR